MAVCPNCHETNPEAGGSCPRCDGFHYVPEESLEDAATDPMIGRTAAGKYVILGLISEGGMGAVYRALQMPVEREVAFKVLRTELKDSDNGRDRFIREARAVSRLNHPNIITLYDFGFEDGKHPYMVMEYAPGKSLAKWLQTEPLTIERILRVTAQILSALNEAHQHGIVHRDLKPENMIVSPRSNDNDRVKLLDFGIARMINEGSTRGLTREGEVFGTPHYMAPEQAQGKKNVGPPADVYAVGIMLWEMLCGECPFDAPTPLAVLFMHINDPLPELRPREGLDIPPGLPELVQKAASKAPVDRYQTASELMSDLSHLFASATGSHTGVFGGEMSGEFGFGDTPPQAPSGVVGEAVRRATPIPATAPHFTPMADDVGAGVHVNDPDSTRVSGGHVLPPDEPGSGSNKILGAVAAVVVVAVVAMVALLISLTMSDGESRAEGAERPSIEPQIAETSEGSEGSSEVAAKEEGSTAEPIVVERIERPPASEDSDETDIEQGGTTEPDEPENVAEKDSRDDSAAKVTEEAPVADEVAGRTAPEQQEKIKPAPNKSRPTTSPKPTKPKPEETKPAETTKPQLWKPLKPSAPKWKAPSSR